MTGRDRGPGRHVARRPGEIRREVDEEIEFHLEMRRRRLQAEGYTSADAHREALRQFGDLAETRAVCYESDYRREHRMERKEMIFETCEDARLALRQLTRRPAFAIVAVLTLAVGIGANTAIFSAADHVLLRPLPYGDAERVVTLWETDRGTGELKRQVSPGNFLDWRERSRSFEPIALAEPFGFDLTGDGGPPEPAEAWLITEGFLDALGVQPVLGRAFLPDEHRANAGFNVLISHRLWRDRLGGDSSIVGRTIELDRRAATVVGVLPPRIEYPERADVWAPKTFLEREREERASSYMSAVARLRPGMTLAAARADMDRVASELAREYPATNADGGVNVIPLSDQVLGDVRPALLVLMGAVGLVLLIACANVASLLLARGSEREREFGLRVALGAGRGRLLRQLVTESLVLALLAGLIGTALAWLGVRALVASSPPGLPRVDTIAIDARVLAFTFGITLLTGLLFGLMPALQLSRPDIRSTLGSGTRAAGAARGSARLRGALVVGEIALALVLLIGAGLLGRSFLRLLSNDVGFETEDRVAVQLFLWDLNATGEQRLLKAQAIEERMRAERGVTGAGITSALPFHPSQIDPEDNLIIDGRAVPEGRQPLVYTTIASPGYFDVMGIPLRAGRTFTDADHAGAPTVALINETLARRHFQNEDPVGKRVTIGAMSAPRSREIIGVVADVRPTSLDSEPRPELFIPYAQSGTGSITFVIATKGDAYALVPRLREAVWVVDPNQAVYHAATIEQLISDTLVERRFNLILLGALSLVALILATVGVYGLINFATQQRSAEIGVRMALGARRSDVTGMIVLDALRLALPGVVLGVLGALLLTRFLSSMLYDVRAADPLTFVQLALLMLAVAVAAAWLPARRAAGTDPMRMLRQD